MKVFSSVAVFVVGAVLLISGIPQLHAEGGMWTFDNFPSKAVQEKYGFDPSQAWLDHVRTSSLRLAQGCSASLISPNALVMTNHHCVLDCAKQLSTAQHDFSQSGFSAQTQAEEKKCPDFELDQLMSIQDVTKEMQAATAGKTGDAANKAIHAEEAKLQDSCGTDPAILCEVVSLYHGGVYDLYHYKKYTDVRLVFAPEFAIGQFGGDPDNFNFPRYGFDLGLLRIYVNDKPLASPEYLHWSANGSKAGELVFISGDPGSTSRELTVSQLEYLRDSFFPHGMPTLAEYRGELEEFMARGPEQLREGKEDEFFLGNDFKEFLGEQQALLDHPFFATLVQDEQHLQAAVAADPKLAEYASAWDDLAKVEKLRAQLNPRATDVNGFLLGTGLLGNAIDLVRSAEERAK
ncbi:MAG TPA: S46 family peptidase, partial [Candidatus Kapabacteria bacterium]|nr:S46 family peptidase [Candidatus Kapabacteria bacterium]